MTDLADALRAERGAFLTDAEVERLTGYRMFKRQCAQLKRQGIYFTVTRSGSQLAGMSLPMVCGDDEETKNRFHARRAWEFIGIAARAKTEIDAARAAAGGGK